MQHLIDEYLKKIRAAQRKHLATGDTVRAVAAYDELLGELLGKFESASQGERETMRRSMSRESTGLLLGAAEGAATWAIRENNTARLRTGLAALLIENLKEDYRESLIELTLLQNSAKKLSVDLQSYYEAVRHFGASEGLDLFDSYFAEGGKTLDEIGYRESLDDVGEFTYLRAW